MNFQESQTLALMTDFDGITPAELRSEGIASPAKVVSNLRRQGHCIFTNKTQFGTMYKLGKPTKRMIAMAFAVAGPRCFM